MTPRAKGGEGGAGPAGEVPGSPLREDALALTADIAWQSGAFRKAADALDKLRELSPAGESVALDLAAADCYFLNRDHALAAAALAPPAGSQRRGRAGRGAHRRDSRPPGGHLPSRSPTRR